jgi:RNA polymerase sigma-70 factor (ECF subfamily)
MSTSADHPLKLLTAAQRGERGALGALVELYRNYLHLLARVQIDSHTRRRVSPSDLVQETLARACQRFPQFRGTTEAEFLAWLRTILVHAVRTAVRDLAAGKRDVRREISLHSALAALDNSSREFDRALVSMASSPSQQIDRREMSAVIADRLARLPEHYREIIVLRNLEGQPFEVIAQQMGRSAGAARVLWFRALKRLQAEMNES